MERLGQSLRRFPIAMLLVAALTCFLIYSNHGGDLGPKKNFFGSPDKRWGQIVVES